MGWQQFMPKALTHEQIRALIAGYPDDVELWNRAWNWFAERGAAGVPYEVLKQSMELLEVEWMKTKRETRL